MESFLEANRIVESSLAKLNQGREMPLRKALLVSNVINRAQECAHLSFINCSTRTTRASSKLLASMQTPTQVEDTAVSLLDIDAGHHRPSSHKPKPLSPMVLSHCSAPKEQEDEVMEFISNSVLSDILSDSDSEMETSLSSQKVETTLSRQWISSPTTSPLSDLSNTRDWPSWTKPISPSSIKLDRHWSTQDCSQDSSPPPSPGKRHHDIAFSGDQENLFNDLIGEDTKRFKASTSEHPYIWNSLPGFCDYLSPRNLCSAPLITYMFGKGFATPSDPNGSDWPVFGSLDSNTTHRSEDHYVNTSPSKLFPVLAY